MMKQAVLDFLEAERAALGDDARLYVVADCSRDRTIRTLLQALGEESVSLYQGEALAEYGDESPWLATAGPHAELWTWLVEEGLGRRWGVFIVSTLPFPELRSHLRKFAKVRTTDGASLFFRFFDPQVLAGQVRVFSKEQRERFYAGIATLGFEIGDDVFMAASLLPDGRLQWRSVRGSDDQATIRKEGYATLPDVNLAGSAARPVFVFTREQMELPILINRPLLIEYLIDYLEDDFRARMNLYPKGYLQLMIAHSAQLAIETFRIHDLAHIKLFAGLMWRIAPGFHKEPQINAVLRRTDVPARDRFDRILQPDFADAWARATDLRGFRHWLPFEEAGLTDQDFDEE